MNPHDLIAEYYRLDDWLEAESKRFDAHVKPTKTRIEEIKQLLLGICNEQKVDSMRTDAGTAYKSTIMTPSIENRDSYLDFIFDNWDEVGNEMLQLGAPKKEAVTNYMQDNEGKLPPGVKTASFTRINIRRS